MTLVKIYKPTTDAAFLNQIAFIIFVAGFRYSVVDKKWPNIKKAFSNFSITKLAKATDKDVDCILAAKDMIKNRGKIAAILENARIIAALKKEHGTVLKWVDSLKKAHNKDPLFNPSLGRSVPAL